MKQHTRVATYLSYFIVNHEYHKPFTFMVSNHTNASRLLHDGIKGNEVFVLLLSPHTSSFLITTSIKLAMGIDHACKSRILLTDFESMLENFRVSKLM